MANLLTDLLYYDVDKDALKIVITSFCQGNQLPEKWIQLLIKKIDRFGEETPTILTEPSEAEQERIKLTKRSNKWFGFSALESVKQYISNQSPIKVKTQEMSKSMIENHSDSTAGLSDNSDIEDIQI